MNKLCFVCRYNEGFRIIETASFSNCELKGSYMRCENNKFYNMKEQCEFHECDKFEQFSFDVGNINIKKIDVDYYQMKMYNKRIKICGGDLESIFSGIIGIEEIKENK